MGDSRTRLSLLSIASIESRNERFRHRGAGILVLPGKKLRTLARLEALSLLNFINWDLFLAN